MVLRIVLLRWCTACLLYTSKKSNEIGFMRASLNKPGKIDENSLYIYQFSLHNGGYIFIFARDAGNCFPVFSQAGAENNKPRPAERARDGACGKRKRSDAAGTNAGRRRPQFDREQFKVKARPEAHIGGGQQRGLREDTFGVRFHARRARHIAGCLLYTSMWSRQTSTT